MNRTEAIGVSVFGLGALVCDAYFMVSRCACSPEIHWSGVGTGLLLQGAAVAVPLAINEFFHDSDLKVRLRAFGIGLFACVASLPLMEMAILFGDSIGQAKGFPSSGYTCEYSRLFPDGRPPNKRVQTTCETHAPDA